MAQNMKPSFEQCKEALKNASGTVSTALATLMLACQLQVAQAQTTPTSSSTSATLQPTKGYGQEVLLKDGSKMLFADVAKLGIKEQEEVIEQMEGAKSRLKLTSYLAQVANQEGKVIDARIQTANQEADNAAMRKQAAIDKNDTNVRGILANVEKMLALGKKLGNDERAALHAVIAYGKPPDAVKRAKDILNTV